MKRRCPSCGAIFDGKRCGECLYTSFSDEIRSPTLHTHGDRVHTRAELDDSQCSAQPQRPVQPRWQASKRRASTKVRKGVLSILLSIVIIWLVVFLAVPVLLFRLLAFDTDWHDPVETEYASQVAKPVVELYCDNRVRVVVEWDGGPITDTLTVAVENFTDEPLLILTPYVSVNGIMEEDCFIYCEAEPNTISEADFWFMPEDLEFLGIEEIYQVEYVVEVMDTDYNTLSESDKMTFGCGGTFELPQQKGLEIWNDAGVRILYQGLREDTAEYPYLLFYAENLSKEDGLQLTSSDVWVNGEEASFGYWQFMFPGTSGFTRIYVDKYEAADMREIEMILRIIRPDNAVETDPITFPAR